MRGHGQATEEVRPQDQHMARSSAQGPDAAGRALQRAEPGGEGEESLPVLEVKAKAAFDRFGKHSHQQSRSRKP